MRPGTPKTGDRVVAFASAYLFNADPDYGAYQEYVLISEDVVSILPGGFTFVEGSVFPMAAWTTWNGWFIIGAFAVQEARLMGLTVYATAGVKNLEYVKGLAATKEDGVVIRVGYHATGSQQLAVDVLGALGQGSGNSKLAIAPIVEKDSKVPDDVETTFVLPPDDIDARNETTRWIFGTWLQEKLASKEVVASPYIKVVEGGLASANKALDEWKAGVSCTKIVFEV
ncbi:hypothetical protein N7490_003766 [Penicillium lividum]|nr:hypothetical protein N7490_003766 [Penicillium lividum]